MGDIRLFGPTIDLASRALDLRARRHEMIISNIANADTPGYKAFDLLVDEALNRTSAPNSETVNVLRTQPGHLAAKAPPRDDPDIRINQPTTPASLRGDGNTVDMEREMSNLAENQILYKATTRVVSEKFDELMQAIQGGKR